MNNNDLLGYRLMSLWRSKEIRVFLLLVFCLLLIALAVEAYTRDNAFFTLVAGFFGTAGVMIGYWSLFGKNIGEEAQTYLEFSKENHLSREDFEKFLIEVSVHNINSLDKGRLKLDYLNGRAGFEVDHLMCLAFEPICPPEIRDHIISVYKASIFQPESEVREENARRVFDARIELEILVRTLLFELSANTNNKFLPKISN